MPKLQDTLTECRALHAQITSIEQVVRELLKFLPETHLYYGIPLAEASRDSDPNLIIHGWKPVDDLQGCADEFNLHSGRELFYHLIELFGNRPDWRVVETCESAIGLIHKFRLRVYHDPSDLYYVAITINCQIDSHQPGGWGPVALPLHLEQHIQESK